MSIGKLVVKHAFGVNPNARNCIAFSEDHHLAYACGHNVAVINTESRDQNFINLGSSHLSPYQSLGITAVACSFPKKFIAIAEKADPVAVVSFYDSHSLRKKKTLNYSDLGSREIRCMAFSDDGRLFLTQGAGPEWNIVLWNIEKSVKVIGSLKTSSSDDNPIHQISFCPWDSTVIIVIGRSILKCLRILEGQIRPGHTITIRREQANILSHCWLPDDNLLVGTEAGEILLLEGLEYRTVVYPTGFEKEDITPVMSFAATSRGFVAGTLDGELRIFERQDEAKERYVLDESLRLPGAIRKKGNVVTMVVGPDDTLVCGTDTQQLYMISMNNLQHVKDGVHGFDHLFTSFHGPGPTGESTITGIDVALWKPIVATCGKDNTVRIWNPSDKKMELVKEFEEEPVSLSMHPSGTHVAVAFSDSIKVASVLLDDLSVSHEIMARHCSFVKFSKGGQFIAAINGNNVQVFNTYTGTLVCTLRGHNNKICSLLWMNFDSRIMTIGAEGVIYYWDLFPQPVRRPEQFSTVTSFVSGTSLCDGSRAFASTNDHQLKEISFCRSVDPVTGVEGPIKDPRDLDIGHTMSVMIMDESRKLLIIGTSDEEGPGSVITIMTNPYLNNTHDIAQLHSGAVTVMCLSYDGNHLYSGDTSGCLLVSEFDGAAGKFLTKNREGVASYEFIDEVLIKKSDLECRKGQIADLTSKVEELTLNNEHQLRLKEMDHADKVNDISLKFSSQLSAESERYDCLLQEKYDVESNFKKRMRSLEEAQNNELRDIEIKYKTKINAESNRHKLLMQETEELHQRWNEENRAMIESHQLYLQEINEEFEDKLHTEQKMQRSLQSEKEVLVTQFGQQNEAVELDGAMEISDMKVKYEIRLKQEEETGLELMAQHAFMKKNLQLLTKDSDSQKEEIKRLKDKENRLLDTIKTLEKDILSHKKEIREREETITDKEKRIFDLKKKNQELEKFRFVLDYKIKELKLQIAPRENEIATMRKQIEDMGLELEQYHKSNLALNLMIDELKLKLDGIRREVFSQEERVDINNRLIDRFKRDLQVVADSRAEYSALKQKMVKLYRVYVQEDVAAASGASGDAASTNAHKGDASDPQQIYNRDREQMERSLDSLRRALKTDAISHNRDFGKMMRESVVLTQELNNLRKDARSMLLQKTAVEQAGVLGPKTDIATLLDTLGIDVKRPRTPPGSTPATPGAAIKPPVAPAQSRLRSKNSARSTALRTTSADGKTQRLGEVDKAEQWEAWREIQMQHEQIQLLEEHLSALCHSMMINPTPILAGIAQGVAASLA